MPYSDQKGISDEEEEDPQMLYSDSAVDKGERGRTRGEGGVGVGVRGGRGEGHKGGEGGERAAMGLGLGLGLNIAETKERAGLGGMMDECMGLQEQEVEVVFDLPDGSQGEGQFKLGHSIELLKSYVESEYGIPMEDQRMYIDDKMMLDPLSLLDYPEAKGLSEIFIRVEGTLPADSKK